MDNDFNVMDMIDDYADENGISSEDVFNQETVKNEEVKEEVKAKPGEWMPDEETMKELTEFNSDGGAVYEANEIKTDEDNKLLNIADEMITKAGEDAIADLQYKQKNIVAVKNRLGIRETHIPPGEWETRFMLAASDPDSRKAQEALEALFKEFEELFPEAVTYVNESNAADNNENNDNKDVKEIANEVEPEETTVVIDKRQLTDVTWSDEDISKIKKSRVIEFNIVEGADLEFGSIEEVNDVNAVDKVLSEYSRKTNDKVGVLPASKYRATFTGLTYPEVIDLTASFEMNSLDAERKKWDIAFKHIKNPSIGPWKSYVTYRDELNRIVQVNTEAEIPDGVNVNTIRKISEFDDFLKKTSYMDLEYILWMVLCATTMNQEIVSIDCHATIDKEKKLKCNNTYEWIYNPSDLLQKDRIPEFVLNDMQEAMDANTVEEIQNVYKTSPVHFNNYVTLHNSGFKMVYGHISAYDFLNSVYGKIRELDNIGKDDPTLLTTSFSASTLVAIDSFIIPKEDGTQVKIKGVDNIMKILNRLDEIDWQIVAEIQGLIINPYQMKFSIRDVICPKCKHKSTVAINDISALLFIVAQSLSNVNVTLKKQ